MKKRTIAQMLESKRRIERGETAPASVWVVQRGTRGAIIRKWDSKAFQSAQKAAWMDPAKEA